MNKAWGVPGEQWVLQSCVSVHCLLTLVNALDAGEGNVAIVYHFVPLTMIILLGYRKNIQKHMKN